MHIYRLAALLNVGILATAAAHKALPRRWSSHDYYVLHLEPGTSPDQVAQALGLAHEGPFGELQDHYLFAAEKAEEDMVGARLKARRQRKRELNDRDILDTVQFAQKQHLREPWQKRIPPPALPGPVPYDFDTPDPGLVTLQASIAQQLAIEDPIFNEQWHLLNVVQPGHDLNLTGVWLQGVTGKNTTVAIVDDGLDMHSDDLRENYYPQGSYDFNDKTDEPRPRLIDDRHGTRCAGEVSAVRNNVCGVGVAFESKIAGLRILSKMISDADEAVALNYDFQNNQIYSCSWGPPDDGRSMDAPGILIRRAMLNAIQRGRAGLGSIYVFASGNGAANNDNCNFDGYTNSIYSITVGAIDRKGLHPYYSEKCSASLVVTYSSGSNDAIHTTDVGRHNCYNGHGGTSAAAPLAAGIFALVLQVRPDFTWRDMQYLAMTTAIPVNTLDDQGNWDADEWQNTTIGKSFSHTYGYGKIDTWGIVEAAKEWKLVKPQAWLYSPWIHVDQEIPQGTQGLAVSFEVTAEKLRQANLERVEHVTVTMDVTHTRRGDLSVDLVSPNKVVSHLSVARLFDAAAKGYEDWTFMTVAHWGESGEGTWTIIVKDVKENEHTGVFVDWHLKLWGECIDPEKAQILPMPTEKEDESHGIETTITASASTTSLSTAPATGTVATGIPDDHPSRPSKVKPTAGSDIDTTSTPDSSITNPTASPAEDAAAATPTETFTSWLPGFLPTFGVASGKTLAWIYGAIVLIVLFCVGLGVYLYLDRRRQQRRANPRDDYEFELLNEGEADGLTAGDGEKAGLVGRGAALGKRARKTRGGELYDAFAGGSDDEEEEDAGDDGDEDEDSSFEEAAYRDDEKGRRRREENGEEKHHVVGDDSDESDEGESGGSRGR